MLKIFFINLSNTSSRIVCAYILLCILISMNVFAETCPFIDRDVLLNQQTNFSISGSSTSPIFNLVTKSDEQVLGEVVKFLPFITSNGLPVSKDNPKNKSNEAKNDTVTIKTLKELCKHLLRLFFFFLFGYFCGGGFVWSPFYRKSQLSHTTFELRPRPVRAVAPAANCYGSAHHYLKPNPKYGASKSPNAPRNVPYMAATKLACKMCCLTVVRSFRTFENRLSSAARKPWMNTEIPTRDAPILIDQLRFPY